MPPRTRRQQPANARVMPSNAAEISAFAVGLHRIRTTGLDPHSWGNLNGLQAQAYEVALSAIRGQAAASSPRPVLDVDAVMDHTRFDRLLRAMTLAERDQRYR